MAGNRSAKDGRGATDKFFQAVAESLRKRLGVSSVYVGNQADALVIGIPMRGGCAPHVAAHEGCLPMEFVLAQSVFPLGLVYQLVGLTAVGKSALVAEFGRWFHACSGHLILAENETKFNARWYSGIMGQQAFASMPLIRCDSVESWQRALTSAINEVKETMMGSRENPGCGRTFPVLFAVDSIMGKMSEYTQERILGVKTVKGVRGTTGAGAADRGYPIEALLITRYMRTIPQELDFWPFALVLVNQLRISRDDLGQEQRRKSGGEQVNFQESFELELTQTGGRKPVVCKDWEGRQIRISCEKNSFGPTGRSVVTRLLTWAEKSGDQWQTRAAWDWGWSTVHLLNNLLHGERSHPGLRAALKEADIHLECQRASDVENRAWSKTLGMTAKDAAPWTEVGAMFHRNREVLARIRAALNINQRPVLTGAYDQQMRQLMEKAP